jgi:hypothetical protein
MKQFPNPGLRYVRLRGRHRVGRCEMNAVDRERTRKALKLLVGSNSETDTELQGRSMKV